MSDNVKRNEIMSLRGSYNVALVEKIANYYIDSMYDADANEISNEFNLTLYDTIAIMKSNNFYEIVEGRQKEIRQISKAKRELLENKTYSEINNEIQNTDNEKLKAVYLVEILKNSVRYAEIESKQPQQIETTSAEQKIINSLPDELKKI